MNVTPEQIAAGQAAYTERTLPLYDLAVLGISNRFFWQCPTRRLLRHYDTHVSANHLDVGVGTGYFLDRCRFPTPAPRVALMDLNGPALEYTARRIGRYAPESYQRNVLAPIPFEGRRFDSVGLNYLLHCLPGTMPSKGMAFAHLRALMNPGATIFGSTLLHGGVHCNWPARQLMELYNRKGIFCNREDDLEGLHLALQQHFSDITIETVGCAALFAARRH